MQTHFTDAQLADPDTAVANQVLRSCVHCGLCTATCPTFQLLGDELDSPRGRIYLIKDMLENNEPATQGSRSACGSLLVVPVVHDDVPLRRALHASGGSCPRLYRTHLPPAADRTAAARRARLDHSATECISPHARRRAAVPSVGAADPGPGACWHGACARCWRWRRRTSRDRTPTRGRAIHPRGVSGRRGWRCSRDARSRCWRPRSTPRRSGC